jgi:Prolyl oligopeptidase family/TonB-dependent Receptor Plug Domain
MLHRRPATRARPMFWSAEFAAKIILLVPLLAALPAVADDVLSKVVTVNIPAQALDAALMQLSKQAHLQVMLASTSVDGKFTKGVQGTMAVGAALTIMLRDSGMSFTADNQTVTVSPIANPKYGDLADKNSSRVAQASENEKPTEAEQDNSSPGDQAVGDKRSRKVTDSEENADRGLQEIVVTGTHIRGGDSASPVMVFTQYDFDQAGASTPQEFFATLPQIFQGGESETNTLNLTANNPGYGSSVNLRGLGSGSTLVLIDGQRAALSGFLEQGQEQLMAPPYADFDRYLRNSPIFRVEQVDTPLLMLHGDLDYVPIEQAEEFFTLLGRQGKRARFVRYWGEGHVLQSPANFEDFWQRVFVWFSDTREAATVTPSTDSQPSDPPIPRNHAASADR